MLALAGLYVRYGTTPPAGWLLYGIKPVIIAVIAQALWGLARKAVKGPSGHRRRGGVCALSGWAERDPAALRRRAGGPAARRQIRRGGLGGGTGALALLGCRALPAGCQRRRAPVSLGTLFLTFLKIGAVLYGSGYVLLAFLRSDLVERLGWLTDQQLLDAIAVGQVTPGPVFTTATFIGYCSPACRARCSRRSASSCRRSSSCGSQPVHPPDAPFALAGRAAGRGQRGRRSA